MTTDQLLCRLVQHPKAPTAMLAGLLAFSRPNAEALSRPMSWGPLLQAAIDAIPGSSIVVSRDDQGNWHAELSTWRGDIWWHDDKCLGVALAHLLLSVWASAEGEP